MTGAEGTVQLAWSKVKHVKSKQLFLVKTQDGSGPKNDSLRVYEYIRIPL
jgi:hypothetical protein